MQLQSPKKLSKVAIMLCISEVTHYPLSHQHDWHFLSNKMPEIVYIIMRFNRKQCMDIQNRYRVNGNKNIIIIITNLGFRPVTGQVWKCYFHTWPDLTCSSIEHSSWLAPGSNWAFKSRAAAEQTKSLSNLVFWSVARVKK